MGRIVALGFVVVLALASCDRHPPPLTACNGDTPAIPRVVDVAPPNCTK